MTSSLYLSERRLYREGSRKSTHFRPVLALKLKMKCDKVAFKYEFGYLATIKRLLADLDHGKRFSIPTRDGKTLLLRLQKLQKCKTKQNWEAILYFVAEIWPRW